MDGKQPHQLWAEAVRDVGILLFVFAPLDTIVKPNYGSLTDWIIAVLLAVVGTLLVAKGVEMESEP